MSKFDEALELYNKQMTEKLEMDDVDQDLLKAVAKSLGPSIYNNDSSMVSCSDVEELNRVKQNFCIKKLGLSEGKEVDDAVAAVCEEMGTSNRTKYRAVFYYLLVKKFGKESMFS